MPCNPNSSATFHPSFTPSTEHNCAVLWPSFPEDVEQAWHYVADYIEETISATGEDSFFVIPEYNPEVKDWETYVYVQPPEDDAAKERFPELQDPMGRFNIRVSEIRYTAVEYDGAPAEGEVDSGGQVEVPSTA